MAQCSERLRGLITMFVQFQHVISYVWIFFIDIEKLRSKTIKLQSLNIAVQFEVFSEAKQISTLYFVFSPFASSFSFLLADVNKLWFKHSEETMNFEINAFSKTWRHSKFQVILTSSK